MEVGVHASSGLQPAQELGAGEVGYLTASIKTVKDTRVGDTVTEAARPADEALPGYRPVQPMVYCGIYTGGRLQVSGPAGRAGKASAQRRLHDL